MAQFRGTLGRLLIDEALPEPMRGREYALDKKGLGALLAEVARDYPDRYREVSKRLSDLGRMAATATGGHSFGPEHLRKTPVGRGHQDRLEAALHAALDDDTVDDRARLDRIIRAAGEAQGRQADEVYKDALAANNPLALQVLSGARGNRMNLSSLLGSDVLYTDHRGNVIPLPVTRSYSQGLTPEQYWAGTYGARKGVLDVKFAVRDAGALSKQLNQIEHRLVVTGDDDPEPDPDRGLPVDTDDPDNAGALLARPVGPYPRDTVLGPKILKHLRSLGHDRILVRSPTVGGPPEGGVYARDAGIREYGTLPGRGEMIGNTSAQAIGEPLSQGSLSSKHSGGVAGQSRAVGGFQAVNQLIQVPRTFKGGAAHAEVDGTVQKLEPAAAGGLFVVVDGKRHYVPHGVGLKVAPGDTVEAGDVLSEGLPNPATVVRHKGIGEGRRYFVTALRQALGDAGVSSDRRNLELLARGLIDHVELTEETEEHIPGDVIGYQALERHYTPRPGTAARDPESAAGKYFERPVLHYTIGTKVRPSVIGDLKHFGIKTVAVHDEPPPFAPLMIRGMASVAHDPDWLTRMYGSGQKASLLDAVHHGGVSDEHGTSFVPALARAVDFGRTGLVRQPEPGVKPEEIDVPKPVDTPLDLDAIRPKLKFSAYRAAPTDVLQIREANRLIEKAAEELAKQAGPIVDHQPPPPHATIGPEPALPVPRPPQPESRAPQPSILSRFRGGPTAGTGGANPWARFGSLAGRATAAASTATPAQSYAGQAVGGVASSLGSEALSAAARAGHFDRLGRLGRAARWYAGPAPTAGLGARIVRGNLGWNAAIDAAGHAGEARDYYGGLARGAATGDWSGYEQARDANAAGATDAYHDLAAQPFLSRVAAPYQAPLTTAHAVAGAATERINAASDLDQERLRGARLDQRLAQRNAARLAPLQAKHDAGQALTPGEQADYAAWKAQTAAAPRGPLSAAPAPADVRGDVGALY